MLSAYYCAAHSQDEFPAKVWKSIEPARAGWSPELLKTAKIYFESLPPASVVVVDRGHIVAEWGDFTRRVKVSSIRKSLLSALYGIYLQDGAIDLDLSLNSLGIDDDPPLTELERTATLRMLLKSRSGVYHGYVGGTPDMKADAPVRGAHAPDTFWYYNNWDFNALGTAFEQLTRLPIAVAFQHRIAEPLEMQDFRPEDMYYVREEKDAPVSQRSIHPAYHFRMSARDLARLGYLYLQKGEWRGRQLVPKAWVTESTRAHSDAGEGEGYGYLWWVDGWRLPTHSFSARGALAKRIIVFPDRQLVLVYLNYAEVPDNAAGMTDAQYDALPRPSSEQQSHLYRMILDAQQFKRRLLSKSLAVTEAP